MEAILLGRDHPTTGAVEVRSPAPDVALGITRGHHPKPYRWVDPNEDVVAVRRSGEVTALVVADGHNGHEGSHAAVAGLLDVLDGAAVHQPLERRSAARALHHANEHLRSVRSGLSGPNRQTRTTLLLATVASHADGSRDLTVASVGDSALILVDAGGSRQVTRDRHRFLGDRLSLPEVAGSMDFLHLSLEPTEVVVAATDGLTNFTDVSALDAVVVPGDPAATVRALIELAAEGGAGDNVALTVLIPAGAP